MSSIVLPSLGPTEFDWGHHRPKSPELPSIKLRCLFHDVLTSPTLTSHPHSNPPYFGPEKCCWITEIKNPSELQYVLSKYGLGSLRIAKLEISIWTSTRLIHREGCQRNFHCIDAMICPFDVGKNIISIFEDGEVYPLVTSLSLEMPIPTRPQEDFVKTINWECIVALLAHQCGLDTNNDGTDVDEDISRERMFADLNPLWSLGYLGWPLILIERGGTDIGIFKRR